MACSNEKKETSMPALFETKREAIKAAKDYGCSGAHRMGDQWMPCKKHGDHKTHSGNSHHHNH